MATFRRKKEPYQQQIEATDRQIDALVYELYGMTAEKTGVVEGQKSVWWWANEEKPTRHVQARAWMDTGWRVSKVHQVEKWVRFHRT